MGRNMKNKVYTQNINIESTHISLKSDLNKNLIPFIKDQRKIIEEEIRKNPKFTGYKPTNIINNKRILELMTIAGSISDTGPMASVAGSISEICLEYLINLGTKYSIIENGGDIALKTNKKCIIGLYAGKNNDFSYKLGFKIKAKNNSYGVCTSSNSGPSKSFGKTDATIVFCKQSSIADGLATSIGNYGIGNDASEIIHNALTQAEKYSDYYDGVMVVKGESLGKVGHIPKLVKTNSKSYLSEQFEIE